MFVDLIKVFIL